MEKSDVLEFFGGQKRTAFALDLTYQAIDRRGDTLSKRLSAQVILAGIQHRGINATRQQWPSLFDRVAS